MFCLENGRCRTAISSPVLHTYNTTGVGEWPLWSNASFTYVLYQYALIRTYVHMTIDMCLLCLYRVDMVRIFMHAHMCIYSMYNVEHLCL